MNYVKTIEFRGDLATAFTVAVATLGAAGFSVVAKKDRTLELAGPGGLGSSRQNLFCGVSRIRFDALGGRIEMEAEFGGDKLLRVAVPALIVAIAAAGTLIQFMATKSGGAHKPVAFAAVLPPLFAVLTAAVAVPVAFRFLRTRTTKALDALLHNMAVMGRDA